MGGEAQERRSDALLNSAEEQLPVPRGACPTGEVAMSTVGMSDQVDSVVLTFRIVRM